MKDRIVWFIIGLLVGAIISTGSILVYTLAVNSGEESNGSSSMQAPGNMPNNSNFGPQNGSTPPEMPGRNNTQNNS